MTVTNLGDAGAKLPITVADHLPPGVTVTSIGGKMSEVPHDEVQCSLTSVSCTVEGAEAFPTYENLQIMLGVKIAPGSERVEENSMSVVGGGAPSVFVRKPLKISGEKVGFGIESLEQSAEEEGGAPATQAGVHPFQYTTTVTVQLNRDLQPHSEKPDPAGGAEVKDLHFVLPPGFVGNPIPIAQCTDLQFTTYRARNENECPRASIVGVSIVTFDLEGNLTTIPTPVVQSRAGDRRAVPGLLSAPVKTPGVSRHGVAHRAGL